MSIQANENGTLKDISASNTGTFQINGVDHLDISQDEPGKSNYTVALPRTLENYKFFIVIITNAPSTSTSSINSGRIYGSGNVVVIPVSRFLNVTPVEGSNGFSMSLSCTVSYSSGSITKALYVSGINALTKDSTSFHISLPAYYPEVYGIF